mgnify:CR=1 FL=1
MARNGLVVASRPHGRGRVDAGTDDRGSRSSAAAAGPAAAAAAGEGAGKGGEGKGAGKGGERPAAGRRRKGARE